MTHNHVTASEVLTLFRWSGLAVAHSASDLIDSTRRPGPHLTSRAGLSAQALKDSVRFRPERRVGFLMDRLGDLQKQIEARRCLTSISW
jgi:hypothetical protein